MNSSFLFSPSCSLISSRLLGLSDNPSCPSALLPNVFFPPDRGIYSSQVYLPSIWAKVHVNLPRVVSSLPSSLKAFQDLALSWIIKTKLHICYICVRRLRSCACPCMFFGWEFSLQEPPGSRLVDPVGLPMRFLCPPSS